MEATRARWVLVPLLLALACLPPPAVAAADSSPSASMAASGPVAGSSAIPSPGEPLPLEGTSWRLTQHGGPDFVAVPPDVAAWMTLRAGRLAGWTGCGKLEGSYGRIGDALRVRPDETRRGHCPATRGAVATAMTKGLVRVAAFTMEATSGEVGPQLVLIDAEGGEVLRFEPDDIGRLTGEGWQLITFQVDGTSGAAVPIPAAELTFTTERATGPDRQERGSLVGSSGCNGIVATFSREADRLIVRDVETTEAPCSGELAAQEAAILEVLASSDLRLDLPPDRLVLTDMANGSHLELASPAPLEGSTWLLAAIPGERPGDAVITLQLDAGRLSGEGPCGPYQGDYVSDGRFIRFSGLSGTAGASCRAQERQRKLLLALERAVLLDRDQPQLRMLDATGDLVASFERPPGP